MNTERTLNDDFLVFSQGYAQTMERTVLPYLDTIREKREVIGEGNYRLYCERYHAEPSRGTVVIVHGFTSTVYKYSEIIYSLVRNGFSVVAYDQRGHGRSQRDSEITDSSLTHVDRFEDYVTDLKRVCDTQLKDMPLPHMVFCHSMGGAVTGLFLEENPGVFSRAVFSSPMIEVKRNGLPYGVSKLICWIAFALGRKKKRIIMSKPYSGPEDYATASATGKERFDWYNAAKAADPALQNNGPSYGWTNQSLRVTRMLLKPGEPEKIDIPVRVYGAEWEELVQLDAQKQFARRLTNGTYTLLKATKHEIYRATDAVLFPWWHEVLCFFGGEFR